MIVAKGSLTGSINNKANLKGELNKSVEYLKPITQEKTINPTFELQEVTPDKEYTGLSKVTINPVTNEIDEDITPENIKEGVNILGIEGTLKGLNATEITINPTNEEQVITPEEPYNAFNKVTVGAQSGIDPNLYFNTHVTSSYIYNFGANYAIKKLPPLIVDDNVTNFNYLFSGLYNLEEQPQGIKEASSKVTSIDYMFQYDRSIKHISLDCSNVVYASNTFNDCQALEVLELTDTSNLVDANNMLNNCRALKTITGLNTSKVESFQNTFKGCRAIEEFDLDCSSAKNMANTFQNCVSLKKVTLRNTSKVQNISYILGGANDLEELNEIDASSITNAQYLFQINKPNFTTFGGLKDYGKAFDPAKSANYSYYTLMLTTCPNLSVETLLNILNKLYDIASLGANTQRINMGASLKAKLTATEEGLQAIANAEAKGWNII